MKRLDGKVALVTGASKGIGAAIAEALANEGASVAINYRSDKASAEKLQKKIESAGGRAVIVGGNVADEKEAEQVVEEAVKAFSRLDIVVNNAGVYEFAPIESVTAEHYNYQFNTNVLGLLQITKSALKYLTEGGSIINIGSGITEINPPASVVYTATKAAVDSITKVLAKELGGRKIRVNSINPGVTITEGLIKSGNLESDFVKTLIEQTPLGRSGAPEDIAKAAVFLASDESQWVTGDLILATGGLY
ncbi:MAG TPA: glucose 1-dehydrogenase [Pyrinomonadaceae bacterium]|nr:glucose 1-dehydrogenase [Pyrinomonadaceae bacterium]